MNSTLQTRTLLSEAAERLVAMREAELPPEAISAACEAIRDTIGVTVAGAHEPCVKKLHGAIERSIAPGPALLAGTATRIDTLNAALLNGTASHALDFDDCSNTMGGHPSAPIVPAIIALSEEHDVNGLTFVRSYLAGFEFETRLGRAVNFVHYDKGWHPTATLGTFGAAAAAAAVLELDFEKTQRVLAIAASMAAGIKANFGTDTKPFHVGQSARNGLLAAYMAQEGMDASPDVLEHPQGFFEVFNGAGNYAAENLLKDWADPLDIVETGVAFKQHPCCASTHPAIDAVLSLRAAHALTWDQIAEVRTFTHPRRFRHTNRPNPRSALDGKFSVQYVVARALLEGGVKPSVFTDEAVAAPEIRALMSRVTSAPHPGADMASSEHFYAYAEIDLRDGQTLKAYVDRPHGRDRDHPLPEGALGRKFMACTVPVLGEVASEELCARLAALNDVSSVASLFSLLAVRG